MTRTNGMIMIWTKYYPGIKFTFILVLFFNFGNYVWLTDFCFEANKEGHRLKYFLHVTKLQASSGVECIFQCMEQDKCCRSVNFRKNLLSGENCELLHEVATEKSDHLIEDPDFDYYVLLQPNRDSTIFSCPDLPCLNNGTCIGGCGNKTSFCVCLPQYEGKYCEIYHPCKTPQPLGIENGEIPDSSMTASSFYDNDHKSFYARLRKQSTKCSWAPTQKSNSWMQVDLGQQAIVTRIATQGSCYSDWNEYAKSFIIQYSNDSNKWTNYKELGEVKIFQANSDKTTIVTNEFKNHIYARYMRLLPKSWNSYPTLRLEYYGCRV